MKPVSFSCILLILTACTSPIKHAESKRDNRKEILGRNFSDKEVLSIDILNIEHPMLGGITDSLTLPENQKKKFLDRLDQLEEKGMFKCGKIKVIRLNFEKDTLRLKVCDGKVAQRTSDLYYELKDGSSILEGLSTNRSHP
ncbi:hypothetical protein D3C87_38730 [compost metagenome]